MTWIRKQFSYPCYPWFNPTDRHTSTYQPVTGELTVLVLFPEFGSKIVELTTTEFDTLLAADDPTATVSVTAGALAPDATDPVYVIVTV